MTAAVFKSANMCVCVCEYFQDSTTRDKYNVAWVKLVTEGGGQV